MDIALHDHYARLEPHHWWFQGRRQVVASVLRRSLRPPPSGAPRHIFDVGCGTGEMTDMLRAFGSVTGIDAAPEAVAHCQERFGEAIDVRLGTLPHDLPGPGQADVITAFDVVEHLDDDRSALLAIHRSLAPGGTLVVTVPAFAFLWSSHDVVNHHRRRYTRPQLRERLESAGFVVERISYFNTWLFPAAAAVRLVRSRRHSSEDEVATDDFTLPAPWLNRLLLRLFASEGTMLRFTSLPVGVSILALARRPPI